MARAARILTVHLLTGRSSVTPAALAFPVEAVAVVVAIRNLAFIVSYGALSALPPWVAATGTLFVFTV